MFVLKERELNDITKLVLSAPAKQSDLDLLPTWLVKDCIDPLLPYITHLFNTSMSTGFVPDVFKVVYVTPLLKKPCLDADDAENYRPESNLSMLSKTLECAVLQQVELHLHSAGLLPPHQSAYKKGHSTETALVKVCADLIKAVDNHALLALLDLSETFDTVDHAILLEHLDPELSHRPIIHRATLWQRVAET